MALWIAQWPQSVVLFLPGRVPERNFNDLAVEPLVCYVVLKDCGYVRLGRCELLPHGSRHSRNVLLETCCARRRLTGTSFRSRLEKTREGKSQAPIPKRYAGFTITDHDYLPFHIRPLVWLEFKVAAHVVLSHYRILVRAMHSVRGSSKITRRTKHSRRRRAIEYNRKQKRRFSVLDGNISVWGSFARD
jgi:hypothetical protein